MITKLKGSPGSAHAVCPGPKTWLGWDPHRRPGLTWPRCFGQQIMSAVKVTCLDGGQKVSSQEEVSCPQTWGSTDPDDSASGEADLRLGLFSTLLTVRPRLGRVHESVHSDL